MTLRPGSCTLRLQNIQTLSSAAKKTLLQAIANDITAAFISIATHTTAGHLDQTHTDPIRQVIASIKDTAHAHCLVLERKVQRYRERLRQSRREQRWMRREVRQFVRKLHMGRVGHGSENHSGQTWGTQSHSHMRGECRELN